MRPPPVRAVSLALSRIDGAGLSEPQGEPPGLAPSSPRPRSPGPQPLIVMAAVPRRCRASPSGCEKHHERWCCTRQAKSGYSRALSVWLGRERQANPFSGTGTTSTRRVRPSSRTGRPTRGEACLLRHPPAGGSAVRPGRTPRGSAPPGAPRRPYARSGWGTR
jgi:hypothetical protein